MVQYVMLAGVGGGVVYWSRQLSISSLFELLGTGTPRVDYVNITKHNIT